MIKKLNAKRPTLNAERGFTLIEIMAVTVVTVILTGVVLGYSRTGEQNILLFRDQAKIVNALLRAKSLALQTYVKGGAACAYGVHLDLSGSFQIFKDKDELLDRQDCSSANNRYSPNLNEDLDPPEIFSLDGKLDFAPDTVKDIVFIPPEPRVLIDQSAGEGRITIRLKDGSKQKTIYVNRLGQITTQ